MFLGLGLVQKCTLTGSVKTVSYGNRSYCLVFKGLKGQNAAMDECKKLNARLPLPKSKGEADEFRKVTKTVKTQYYRVWIGIRDLLFTGVRSEWKDVEGNVIGSAYVNFRVRNLVFNIRFFLTADSVHSGTRSNQTKMELLLTGVMMDKCLIHGK